MSAFYIYFLYLHQIIVPFRQLTTFKTFQIVHFIIFLYLKVHFCLLFLQWTRAKSHLYIKRNDVFFNSLYFIVWVMYMCVFVCAANSYAFASKLLENINNNVYSLCIVVWIAYPGFDGRAVDVLDINWRHTHELHNTDLYNNSRDGWLLYVHTASCSWSTSEKKHCFMVFMEILKCYICLYII